MWRRLVNVRMCFWIKKTRIATGISTQVGMPAVFLEKAVAIYSVSKRPLRQLTVSTGAPSGKPISLVKVKLSVKFSFR